MAFRVDVEALKKAVKNVQEDREREAIEQAEREEEERHSAREAEVSEVAEKLSSLIQELGTAGKEIGILLLTEYDMVADLIEHREGVWLDFRDQPRLEKVDDPAKELIDLCLEIGLKVEIKNAPGIDIPTIFISIA